MMTLRLDAELEQDIQQTAQNMGISKSELIRASVIEFMAKLDKPSAWDLGCDVFGQYASGEESLSRDRKQLLTETIKAKQ